MEAQKVAAVVQVALGSSRKIKITFKREEPTAVRYLLGMAKGGIIQLSENDAMTFLIVSESRDWGDDRNRTATVILTDRFELDWFVGRLAQDLEKIEVA